MLLFRCLTYSSKEITETTKTPIIIQVKVKVQSEFALDGKVGLILGKESVGAGATDEELEGIVIVCVLLQSLDSPVKSHPPPGIADTTL